VSTENDDIERQRPATETFPLPPVSAYGRHVADRGTKRTFDELAASSTESYHLAVQEVIDQLLELPRDDWPIIYDELTFVVRIGTIRRLVCFSRHKCGSCRVARWGRRRAGTNGLERLTRSLNV